MNYDKIKDTVNKYGLVTTLNLFGGNKDIIRKAYIDNPESYLDYLIGNLRKVNRTVVSDLILFRYGDRTIFKSNHYEYDRRNGEGIILVDDFIWEYFYVNVMNFTNDQIQDIFKSWLEKHLPDTKHLTPKSNSIIGNLLLYKKY